MEQKPPDSPRPCWLRENAMSNNGLPDYGHRTCPQLIEGSLECTAHATGDAKAYSPSYYYGITPEGYLHGYKSYDDFHRRLSPGLSLYLPGCTLGAVDGATFTIHGKVVSGPNVAGEAPEFTFKARSPADAEEWWSVVRAVGSGPVVTDTAPPFETGLPKDGEKSSTSRPRRPEGVQAPPELQRAASFSSPVCYACYEYD